MRVQKILESSQDYRELDMYLEQNAIRKIFLVCGSSISYLKINDYFSNLQKQKGIEVVRFSDFHPNPVYESVVKGIEMFVREKCDLIIAVGGGSAIDVAKCIKLYANMDSTRNYLEQEIVPNTIKFLAVPTTAGTGSEVTRYAVIYYEGEKQSISDYSCIPEAVLLDSSVLSTLPLYQKKVTMLDALCHAIESFWSVNSTPESQKYSSDAIQLIMDNKNLYLQNDEAGNRNMMMAANIAGKAINITQTTAGHALCYKITGLYGIAHGHAAAICVSKLWPFMLTKMNQCIDLRGESYLKNMFQRLAEVMGSGDSESAIRRFEILLDELQIERPKVQSQDEYEVLKVSVNPVRLKNNPIALSIEDIDELYHSILT